MTPLAACSSPASSPRYFVQPWHPIGCISCKQCPHWAIGCLLLTRLFPKVIHEYIGNISTICVYFLKGCLAKHMVCITSTLTLAILPQLNKKLKLKREKSYLYSVKQQKRVTFNDFIIFFLTKIPRGWSCLKLCLYFTIDTLGWII